MVRGAPRRDSSQVVREQRNLNFKKKIKRAKLYLNLLLFTWNKWYVKRGLKSGRDGGKFIKTVRAYWCWVGNAALPSSAHQWVLLFGGGGGGFMRNIVNTRQARSSVMPKRFIKCRSIYFKNQFERPGRFTTILLCFPEIFCFFSVFLQSV